jgi:chromosome segregation ATPase
MTDAAISFVHGNGNGHAAPMTAAEAHLAACIAACQDADEEHERQAAGPVAKATAEVERLNQAKAKIEGELERLKAARRDGNVGPGDREERQRLAFELEDAEDDIAGAEAKLAAANAKLTEISGRRRVFEQSVKDARVALYAERCAEDDAALAEIEAIRGRMIKRLMGREAFLERYKELTTRPHSSMLRLYNEAGLRVGATSRTIVMFDATVEAERNRQAQLFDDLMADPTARLEELT